MPQTQKQQQGIKKYWDDMKKEFEESSETNFDKFMRSKNEAITKDIMMSFDLIEKNPTHYIYKCACGSILKKRYNHKTEKTIVGATNTGLKSHLKSKKHISRMNYQDNKEKIITENKEKIITENKEKIITEKKQNKYYQENKEEILEYQHDYTNNNKEKISLQKKEYRKRMLDSKKFYCEKCDHAFESNYKLKNHLKTENHLLKF